MKVTVTISPVKDSTDASEEPALTSVEMKNEELNADETKENLNQSELVETKPDILDRYAPWHLELKLN